MITEAIELLNSFRAPNENHMYRWEPGSYFPQIRDLLLQWLYFYNTTHTTFDLSRFRDFIDMLLCDEIDLVRLGACFKQLFTVKDKVVTSYFRSAEFIPQVLAYKPENQPSDFATCLRAVSNVISTVVESMTHAQSDVALVNEADADIKPAAERSLIQPSSDALSYGPHDYQAGPFDYYSVMQELKHLRGLLKLSNDIDQLPLSPGAVNALRTLSNIELQSLLTRSQFCYESLAEKCKQKVWSDYNSDQYPFYRIDDIRYSYMDKKQFKQRVVSLLREVSDDSSNEHKKQTLTQFLFYYLLLADGDQMFVQAFRWSDACKPIPVRSLKPKKDSLANRSHVLLKKDLFLHLCHDFLDVSDIVTLSTLCVATYNHIHASDNIIHQRINTSRDATRNDLMKNQDEADKEVVQLLAACSDAKKLWKNTVNAVIKVVMLQYYFYSLELNREQVAALKKRFGPGQYLPKLLDENECGYNSKYSIRYGHYTHYNSRCSQGYQRHEDVTTSSPAEYAKVHLRNLLGLPVEFRFPTSGQDAISLLQGKDKAAVNRKPMLWDLVTYLRVKPGDEFDYSSTFHVVRKISYNGSYERMRQNIQVPEVDRLSDSQWLSMVINLIERADTKDQSYWKKSIKFIAATPALFIAVLNLIVHPDLKDNKKGCAMVLLYELLLYNPLDQYKVEQLREYRRVVAQVLYRLFRGVGVVRSIHVLVNNSRAMDYYRNFLRWRSPHRLFARVESDYPRYVHQELTRFDCELKQELAKRRPT